MRAQSLRVRVSLCLAISALPACSAEPPGVATGAATAATRAAAARPPADNVAVPRIVTVSPDTFSVVNGQATMQSFEVAYEISDPSQVDTARLEAYAREYGVISRMDVPVQARGTAHFVVEPRGTVDLGPTVRFRATCPAGTTEWFELGQVPQSYDAQRANTFGIMNVAPTSIKDGPDDSADSNQRGVGTRIKIFGKKLSAACSIDAQVDGSSVQLNNPLFYDGRWEGLLMRRDHNYRAVAPRYIELKFVIRGKKLGREAIKNLPFAK